MYEMPLLFSRHFAPIYLLCGVVLLLGGGWVSDYGLTTQEYSEPVADIIWFCGWLVGVIGGVGVMLAILCWVISFG